LWEDIRPQGEDVGGDNESEEEALHFVGKYFLSEITSLDADVASMLKEPSEEDIDTILNDPEGSLALLHKVLCILFEWMKSTNDELVESAGDLLLNLSAKNAFCRTFIVQSQSWHDLFLELLRSSEEQEMVAALCWNMLKGSSITKSEPAHATFRSKELIEALVEAGNEGDDCLNMACGALAYCSPSALWGVTGGTKDSTWVLSVLGKGLQENYQERADARKLGEWDSEGDSDITDFEDAIAACISRTLGEIGDPGRQKKVSKTAMLLLKGELGDFFIPRFEKLLI
jgi:hypothetical protein